MAVPNLPMGEFADPNFGLLSGPFWNDIENREHVQAHDLIVEFAQILLKSNPGNPEHKWWKSEWDSTTQQMAKPLLSKKGPLEIVKFFEFSPHLIAVANPNTQCISRHQMTQIRKNRNDITHYSIRDSQPVIDHLLVKMKEVCE